MTDAFVYDAVRTPRGKGKADGSLHEVTALSLATQALGAIKDRNKLDPVLGGDVESMSRVGMGASGGAWPMDPAIAVPTYFLPQGISADLIATKYGFSRDDVDAYAVESQKRSKASWDAGNFKNSVIAVKDINGITILDK